MGLSLIFRLSFQLIGFVCNVLVLLSVNLCVALKWCKKVTNSLSFLGCGGFRS